MNDQEAIKLARQACYYMVGDDLARAKHAFHGMSDAQMEEQHGGSGKTRREVLKYYEEHDQKWTEVVRWVESLEHRFTYNTKFDPK